MLAEVKKNLAGHPWRHRLICLDTVDSTNTYARNLAQQGAPEGTVVIAGHQTGGRGRMGRSFHSPAGLGLYLSLILRPNCPPEQLMHLTCAAGVAAAEAVEAVSGISAAIKWTNDLVVGSKKLGGILSELSLRDGLVEYAIIGIGINCRHTSYDFPEEIRSIACSIAMCGSDTAPEKLAAGLVEALHRVLSENVEAVMGRFREKCITIGREISLVRGETARRGRAISVDEEGGLLVEFSDGHRETVTSGEVSIRGMYGYI